MRHSFYDSIEYKKAQSEKSKLAWKRGLHNDIISPLEKRRCKRKDCSNTFKVKPYYLKYFCFQRCAAIYNNSDRDPLTNEWRNKISVSMTGKSSKLRGKILVPRLEKVCPGCNSKFQTTKWQNNKYCSNLCSIRIVGSRPTSPKAARAKAGIRNDIDPNMYFFSRWEANFARILNLLKIKWEFQPETFNLKTQKYTPDFYLPQYNSYVEIKNFLSEYSLNRDKEFRSLYSNKNLILILKEDYLKLQEEFSPHIKNWEFS